MEKLDIPKEEIISVIINELRGKLNQLDKTVPGLSTDIVKMEWTLKGITVWIK